MFTSMTVVQPHYNHIQLTMPKLGLSSMNHYLTSSGFSEVMRVAMTCPFGLGRFIGLQRESTSKIELPTQLQ